MTLTGSLGQNTYGLYIYDSWGDGIGSAGTTSYTATFEGASIGSGGGDFDFVNLHIFGTACASSDLSLNYQGDNLGPNQPHSECGGDCDNDSECEVSQT